jgi:ArsR family transcriptional regulator
MEPGLLAGRQVAVLPENVRTGDGRMAAEIHLHGGCQPAQMEIAIVGNQEGGFGEVQFARDVAQPVIGARRFHHANRGRISGKRDIGEGIDGDDSNGHFRGPHGHKRGRGDGAIAWHWEITVYFGSWLIVYMKIDVLLRAMANERRLRILEWLKSPREHFPPQVDGDLVKDGVCSLFIAQKLKITQPSASEHLNLLADAGLIRGKKIKQWTFYKRDEKVMRKVKAMLAKL